jgi:hypothetical protein
MHPRGLTARTAKRLIAVFAVALLAPMCRPAKEAPK